MAKKNEGALESLPEAIRVLEGLKSQLDQLDDQVSASIQALEEALRSLGLGVRVALTITTPRDYDDDCEVLAFDKHGGTWRFVTEVGPDFGDSEQWITTPLTDCPRDWRAHILEKHIPALLVSAVKTLQDKIEHRTRVLQTADQVLAAVEKKA